MSKFNYDDIEVNSQQSEYNQMYQEYLNKLADTVNEKLERPNNAHIELKYDSYSDIVKIDFAGSATDKHYANWLLASLSNPLLSMFDMKLTDDNAGKIDMIFGGNYYLDQGRPIVYIPSNPKMAVESARLLMFLIHSCLKAPTVHFRILHQRNHARNLPLNRNLIHQKEIDDAVKSTATMIEEFKKAGCEYMADCIKVNLACSINGYDDNINYCSLRTFLQLMIYNIH